MRNSPSFSATTTQCQSSQQSNPNHQKSQYFLKGGIRIFQAQPGAPGNAQYSKPRSDRKRTGESKDLDYQNKKSHLLK